MRRAFVFVLTALLSTAAIAANSTRAVRTPTRPMTVDNNASCDIGTYPAATLLLPYFEVDVTKPVNDAPNTLFTIINTNRTPQIARVNIWTDEGYPALWFNVFLTGFDVQSISLYDVLARGVMPSTSNSATIGIRSAPNGSNPYHVAAEGCANAGGPVPDSLLVAVQSMLTTGAAQGNECRVGTVHSLASGYVTVDVVNSCSNLSPLEGAYYSQVLLYDNVLTGDYERLNPDTSLGNYAGGNPLVHIKAIPEGGPAGSGSTSLPYTFYDRYTPGAARRIDRRQPLPASFAARFIQGGTGQFQTEYAIWREGVASASSCVSANAAVPFTEIVRFDEVENPAVASLQDLSAKPGLAASSSISTSSTLFPPMLGLGVSGWMYLNLDNRGTNTYSTARPSQNWVIVHMRAEGRYAVDYDATTMFNGCTPSATVQSANIPEKGK